MAPAYGDTIVGVPVVGYGSTDTLGCTLDTGESCYDSGTNTTNFYIPLTGGGDFGIDAGMTSDTVSGSSNGFLYMVLLFNKNGASGKTLTLSYGDMDLDGANTPNKSYIELLESIQFFDSAGNLIGGTLVTQVDGPTSASCPAGTAICALEVHELSSPAPSKLLP